MTKLTYQMSSGIKEFNGNFSNKSESSLLKIREISNIKIFQISQYKNSKLDVSIIKIDDQILSKISGCVSANSNTRILWSGPKTWMVISKNKNILDDINNNCSVNDFAITDLSHSRMTIQIEGKNAFDVIKKGCPLNLNNFKTNMCANTVFNGVTITIDLLDEDKNIFNLMAYRSFADSFYHAITDASLEYGYKAE